MKSFLSFFILLTCILTLSGCSQDPARETTKNQSRDDYTYLSRAFDQNGSRSTQAVSSAAGQSISQQKPANQPKQPLPQVAGDQAPEPVSPRTNPEDAKPDPEPVKPEPTKDVNTPDAGPNKDDDLSYIRKYDGATIKTSEGDITIRFYNDDAPKTVNNFFKLAAKDFYDGIRFHRVIKGFIIQAGDPNSKDDNWSDDGTGGPGYTFEDEFNSKKLVEGSVAMANSGPNTNGSQFFIVTAKSTPLLDGKYTNFGEVTDGMDVVRKIEKVPTDENDHPKENIEIKSVKFVKKK